MVKVGLLVAIALGLASCSPPVSTAYFKAHPKEMNDQVERYAMQRDDPHGQLCRNAAQAYYESVGMKAKNGEPIGG